MAAAAAAALLRAGRLLLLGEARCEDTKDEDRLEALQTEKRKTKLQGKPLTTLNFSLAKQACYAQGEGPEKKIPAVW